MSMLPCPPISRLLPLLLLCALPMLSACKQDAASGNGNSANAMPVGSPAASPAVVAPTALPDNPIPTTKPLQLPGDFRSDDSLASLQQRYGKDNVRVEMLQEAEGNQYRGIVLFPDDPRRRLALSVRDEDTMQGLSGITIEDPNTQWQFEDGLRIGMTLAELVALNGKPITFYGFDWDYGGGVSGWMDGKLQRPGNAPIFRSVVLSRPENAANGSYPIGDSEFRSDDKRYPKLGSMLTVGRVDYSFSDPEEPEGDPPAQ